jgi:hypothetical protein
LIDVVSSKALEREADSLAPTKNARGRRDLEVDVFIFYRKAFAGFQRPKIG